MTRLVHELPFLWEMKRNQKLISISPPQITSARLKGVRASDASFVGRAELFERHIKMAHPNDVSGPVTLATCDSLRPALNDRNFLPEAEVIGIWKDAAAARHHARRDEDRTSELHTAVAKLINSNLSGGNSVRRG